MEFIFLIYFRISKDSFTRQSHIFGEWVATRPKIYIFQQAISYFTAKTNLVHKVVPVEARLYL